MKNIEFLAGTMLQASTSTWLASDTIWAIAAYIGLTVIFAIGVVIVAACITFRRFHDIGQCMQMFEMFGRQPLLHRPER